MAISSMTGFARGEGSHAGHAWLWELRSVNARGLDVRCRLPSGCEAMDGAIRQRVARHLARGSVTVTLTFVDAGAAPAVRVNTQVLDQLLALLPDLQARLPQSPPPSIDRLLGIRGVVEPLDQVLTSEERTARDDAILASVEAVILALRERRRQEGARLDPVLCQQLERIRSLAADARDTAAAQPAAVQARLTEHLQQLLAGQAPVTPERLAQEVALLATRADVREELDRITAHHQAAAALVVSDAPVGRQLDFLCQEFNREANTVCSKSADIRLTRIGLDLKATIEQLREQVQNIE